MVNNKNSDLAELEILRKNLANNITELRLELKPKRQAKKAMNKILGSIKKILTKRLKISETFLNQKFLFGKKNWQKNLFFIIIVAFTIIRKLVIKKM